MNKKEVSKAFLELTFPANTTKSAFATEQLYKLLHTLSRRQGKFDSLFGYKKSYSLEIAASRDFGIRYILVVPQKEAEVIHRSLISFLPGLKVKEIPDYLNEVGGIFNEDTTDKNGANTKTVGILELQLSSDFVLPLQDQKILTEHDSISFLTGSMTKLMPGELISFQIVATPLLSSVHGKAMGRMADLKNRIYKGLPLTPILTKKPFIPGLPSPLFALLGFPVFAGIFVVKVIYTAVMSFVQNDTKGLPFFEDSRKDLQQILNPYEQELSSVVKEKISQALFETSMRVFIVTASNEEFEARTDGIYASVGQFSSPHQSLTIKGTVLGLPTVEKRLLQFKQRVISHGLFAGQNPVLSTSEMSDLYHFPYTDITKVEGLVKSKSKDLPAPLSQKKSTTHLEVVVGTNTYGGEETPVGLTPLATKEHTYIVGKTGSGKTTIIEGWALQDIQNGKGVCVIDPHGDMVEHLLTLIPKHRRRDVVYVNPADRESIVGLNILSPGNTFSDKDETDLWITRSLMSVFMKITPIEHWGQRMEHILRNATLTALQVTSPTAQTPYISLLAIQKLLTDRDYRNKVVETLSDPVLKQFWDKEFKLFGSMQQAEVVSPVTNRLGEFITDKLSRYILLQEKTTIDISQIMDEGKILLVNLSKGTLGEERSAFFGTLFTSLIQLAIYQRAQVKESKRRDFTVFIDEFQNFATTHFASIFSESKKYHVYFVPSHQNIAQIDDPKLSKIVLGNSGNIIALKNGPDDEAVLLPFVEPEVEKGEIVNLSPHHFYMKVTSVETEDAFSGETIPITDEGSSKVAKEIIEYSKKHYTTPRAEVEKQLEKLFGEEKKSKVKGTTLNFALQNSIVRKEKGERIGVKRKNGRKNRHSETVDQDEDR